MSCMVPEKDANARDRGSSGNMNRLRVLYSGSHVELCPSKAPVAWRYIRVIARIARAGTNHLCQLSG